VEERARRLGAPRRRVALDRGPRRARRRALARRARPAPGGARFSRLATVLVALVLAAGTYLAIVRLPALHDLWRSGYGQVLLVKLALVALVLAWGGVHRFFVRPMLASAGDGFLVRVGRSVAGESAVAIAVLLVAAVLVDSKPPQPGSSSPSSRSAYAGAVGSSSWRK
jgi:putative copper export protein